MSYNKTWGESAFSVKPIDSCRGVFARHIRKEFVLKKFFELVPCMTLSLAVGAFSLGCACSDKCKTSEACCDGGADCCKNGGDCKDDCQSGGACKDEKKAQPEAAPAPQMAPAAAPAAQSSAPVNKMCPIGGHDVNPKLTASYQGKTIAFCCDSCVEEFAGMDDSGKAALLAKASAN